MAMSENSKVVLSYLKTQKEPVTKDDIAEATGISKQSVNGVVTLGLVKKQLATSTPATIEVEETDKEGNTVVKTKEVKLIQLTEAGYAFDPDAE